MLRSQPMRGYRADVASHACLRRIRSRAAGAAGRSLHARRAALQRLPQPRRVDQRLRVDLLGRGRGGGRLLRRRGAAEDGDRRRSRGDRGQRRQRAGAGRRRRVPGLAVLHHRAGASRGRALERDGAGRDGLRQPRVRPRAGGAGEVHRDGGVPGAVGQRRRLGRQPAGAAGRGPSGARGRRREGGHPRRDHARDGGDLLARADRELRRAGRLSDRPGGGAGGRGDRQDHPPVASRGRRRHRGGRGGAGHRPDRRRARPRAVLERGRRAACLSADGRGSRRAPGADRAGGGVFEVPRADHGRVRRGRQSSPRRPATPCCSTRA